MASLTAHTNTAKPLLAAFCVLCNATGSWAQPLMSEPCDAQLQPLPGVSHAGRTLDPHNIEVFSWNIQKSSRDGWRDDLANLASQSHLVMLQEATLEQSATDALPDHAFGAFAPGYKTGSQTSGVLTLSTVQANAHCALEHQEPWLLTPKATGLSLYSLQEGPELLVANLHGVNFSLTSEALQAQLADIAARIEHHDGPVIFAGDFNTWSSPRKAELSHISANLGLNSVSFDEDSRITVFGNPLDHILVRGLEVLDSRTYTVDSSDHNPFSVTLRLPPKSVSQNIL
jgi:endonuclease/exonuclease/phosphatase (EEP) superfamily protein YafD